MSKLPAEVPAMPEPSAMASEALGLFVQEGGQVILGCTTKKQFCEEVLRRTPRAVRYLLDGGNHHRGGETVSPSPEPADNHDDAEVADHIDTPEDKGQDTTDIDEDELPFLVKTRRGGHRANQDVPYNPDTPRKRKLAEAENKRLINMITNAQAALCFLPETDALMAASVCSEREIDRYIIEARQLARKLPRIFEGLATKLEQAKSNGAAQTDRPAKATRQHKPRMHKIEVSIGPMTRKEFEALTTTGIAIHVQDALEREERESEEEQKQYEEEDRHQEEEERKEEEYLRAHPEVVAERERERQEQKERDQREWEAAERQLEEKKQKEAACRKAQQEIIDAGRRALAAKAHPDKGGTAEEMVVINIAKERLNRMIIDHRGRS
jgi:hypothetical protein